MGDDFDPDEYASFEARFDPMQSDRQTRRKRKPKVKHVAKKTLAEQLEEMSSDEVNVYVEDGFKTTYKPSLYESEWLLSSLRSFYEEDLITDVLALVKGGKEANVYRCAAGVSISAEFVAAKVYRPSKFRNLSNDQMYRENRLLMISSAGEVMDKPDDRIVRAVGKKSAFGRQVSHTSWLMYEFTTLQKLYELGASVPKPIEVNENTILMSYHGDAYTPATTLNKVRLHVDEARELFEVVLWNIELMLKHDLIHGDLSPYNILYWEGEIILIDFPQVVSPHANTRADFILHRDIERVCTYFNKHGVKANTDAIFRDLWRRYAEKSLSDVLADHWQGETSDDDEEVPPMSLNKRD
jgi:RIO kinase 1